MVIWLVIYKWLAFVQALERFQDLSKFEQFLHIMTNTFVVNLVRTNENDDTRPRKREHILLFAWSILDAAIRQCAALIPNSVSACVIVMKK